MRLSITNTIEMILGTSILALGLLYLTMQYRSTEKLIDEVSERVIDEKSLYLQSNEINMYQISDDALYALIMGYREYPIIIDGHLITVDGIDHELYFSYIRNGYYTRNYVYDADHMIIQVAYTYAGA